MSTAGNNTNTTIAASSYNEIKTKSGNAGHVTVPKDWIGKEAIVKQA
jgi:putative transposon-encoded protein